MTTAVHTTDTRPDTATMALIEEHVRQLLRTMGMPDAGVQCSAREEGQLQVSIEAGDDGRILIGAQGTHLMALQYIVRCLLRRDLGSGIHISVDVNGYVARRERGLMDLAEEVARKAQRIGRTVAMQPMTASDRRLIHTSLSARKDVTTESLGEEPNRRVVVRPVFL